MALKDITQNKAFQARQGTTQTTTNAVQTSVAPAVQPTKQQVTTPSPVVQQVSQQNTVQKPVNKVTGKVAGANNPSMQQSTQAQQQVANTQQVQGDYTTTNPNAQGVSQYTFNEQAKQLNAQDPNYLNNRDDYIANQIVNQLNSLTKQGQKVDNTIYDGVLSDTISKFGGTVDYNNPDWLNTINRINSKIQSKTGAGDMNTMFNKMNKSLSKVNSFTDGTGLFQAISNGEVSKEQMDLIKQTRPDLYQQYATYQDEQFKLKLANGEGLSAETLLYDSIDIDGLFTKYGLDKNSSNDIDLVQKRMEMMATGTVKVAKDEYIAKTGEYQQLQDTIMNIENEVKKQYEGTGATQSYIQAEIAKRTGDLRYKMQELQRGVMIAQENYNLEIGQMNDMMTTYEKQSNLDMQRFGIVYDALSQEQKRRDTMKLADIEYLRDLNTKRYDLQLTYGDINSKDPFVRDRAIEKEVLGLMEQYDGLIQSTSGQLQERIKKDIASGKSFADAIGSIMTDIRNKPEYKSYMNYKTMKSMGITNIGGGMSSIQNSDGTYSVIPSNIAGLSTNSSQDAQGKKQQITQTLQAERMANGGYSQYDNPEFVNQLLSGQLKTRDGTVCVPGQDGGQCGAFVNDMMGIPGLFQSEIQQKIGITQSDELYSPAPVVGGAVVIDTGTKYGHVGIVTAVYPNGTYDYIDSNQKGDEKISIQKGKTVKGNNYFTKAKGKNSPTSAVISSGGGSQSSGGYDQNLSWLYEKATPTNSDLESAGLTPQQYGAQKNAYMQANKNNTKLSDDQRTIFNNQISSFRSNPVVKQFEDAMTQYSNIKSSLENPSGPGDISAIYMFMKSLDPTSVVRESEFNTAASSAGVTGKIGNALTRLQNGQTLTDTQRDAFVALSKKFIENRAKSYDRLYGDMERVLTGQGISSTLLPTKASSSLYQGNSSNINLVNSLKNQMNYAVNTVKINKQNANLSPVINANNSLTNLINKTKVSSGTGRL